MMINEIQLYSFLGLSFLFSAYIFYIFSLNQRRKFIQRMREIDIAQNKIKSYSEFTDKLIKSEILPTEAKNQLLFIGNLLVNEQEATNFLKYMADKLRDKKKFVDESVFYKNLLQKTREHPEILEDFKSAIQDGLIAVMFKWPNNSKIFYELLMKTSTKTSAEVKVIQDYNDDKEIFTSQSFVTC